MRNLSRKIAALLVFVFVATGISEAGNGLTIKAAQSGYTVTFDFKDGRVIKQSVDVGGHISTVPDLPEETDDTQYFWEAGGKKYTASEVAGLVINKNYDFILATKTVKKWPVTFYYKNQQIGETLKIEDGKTISSKDFPALTGIPSNTEARDMGWGENIYRSENQKQIRFGRSLYEGRSITDEWKKVEHLFVNDIRFKMPDGSFSTYTVDYGAAFTQTVLPGKDYDEQKGTSDASIGNEKEFLGWEDAAKNSYGSTEGKFNEVFKQASTTLYPRWNTGTGNFKVTFQVAGLSGATEDIVIDNVAKDAIIINFPTVTKTGYKLTKWIGSDGNEYKSKRQDGDNATRITGDVVLTPQFEINKYEVQFNYRKRNASIPDSEISSTELENVYLKTPKTITGVPYNSLISESEIPADVAQKMELTFLAPKEEGSQELEEYTVTCTYNGKWKTGKTIWNFKEDKVASDMTAAKGADSSLRPCYDITYFPHIPPKDYQYDEESIFETQTCNVNFSYTNKQNKEDKDTYKVKYGRTIPESYYPNDKVLATKTSTFYDKISEDSEEYIEFTATYTFTGAWYKNGTNIIWEKDRFVTENDLTLVPVYSVKFAPFTPWSCGGGSGDSEDSKDSIDKVQKNYCEITFDHNNGSNKKTKMNVPKNQPIDPEVAPKVKKSGMKFVGWAKDKQGTQMYDWKTSPVEPGLILYAIWAEQVDIVYNSEGGNYISVETIALGETAPKIEDPVKKNYTFIGWSKTRQKNRPSTDYGKYAYDFTKPVTKKDVTIGQMKLYAWYKSNTKVRFYYNTSSEDENYHEVTLEEAKDGSFIFPDYQPEEENSPEDMFFEGWFSERDGGIEITKNNFAPKPASELSYYAHWSKGFKITYVLDSAAKEQKTVSYKEGQTPEPIDAGERNGKVITGWYFDKDCTEAAVISEIKKNTVVYGKWEEIKTGSQVTITLDANEGKFKNASDIMAVTKYKAGEIPEQKQLEIPSAPKDSQLIFVGWSLTEAGDKMIDFETYRLQGDVTFYAKWGYSVTFKLDSKVTSQGFPNQYVAPGKKAVDPGDVQSDEFALVGWSEKQKPESKEDFWDFDKNVVTQNTTLYAIWGVSIIFDGNGGYFMDPEWGKVKSMEVELTASDYVEKLKIEPEYPGRQFAGWYKDPFGTEEFEFLGSANPTPVNGPVRIYAKWEDLGLEYQIAVNGGSASQAIAQEDKRIAVIASVPKGKLFVKWDTQDVALKDENKQITTFVMPAKNVNITAVYKNDPNAKDTDSGSGGSSSGGNTPVTDSDKNNKTAEERKIISVTSSVKSGKVAFTVPDTQVESAIEAALLQEAIEEAENVKNPQAAVVLNINTKKNVSKVTIKLSKKAVQLLAEADIDVLKLEDKFTTLKLDGRAIGEINDKTTGDIILVVGKSTQKLSKTVKKAVGNRPCVTVQIQYKKKVNGKNKTMKLTKLDKGRIEVQLPYTPTKAEKKGGTKKLYGVYVDNSGKAYYVKNSTYDADSKTIIFKINQFNTYSIAYKK